MLIIKKENEILQYDDSFRKKFDEVKVPYQVIEPYSDLGKKLATSHEFTPVFTGEKLVDVNVTKTLEKYREEQPKEEKKPTFEERLIAVENELKSLKKG